MISPALQQAVAWHREQTARVRAYRPRRPDIPGKPGDYEVPPPPPATQTHPVMPTELFANPTQPLVTTPAIITTTALTFVGIALFTQLLK
jgi:hypothetical protein